uniref:phage tail fiber protein n=1 Tax=uncultured Sphingomonas sp. TaxID=158754 RepID=UPI0035C9780C
MSKSDAFENALLKLIFNATPIAGIADNAAASPNTNLYLALHTADPGEAGNQSTSEANYTGYARVAVLRTAAGWTVTGNSVSPTSLQSWPAGTAGSGSCGYFSIGTASSGAGMILYSGSLSPAIATGAGVTPQLAAGTTVTED